MTQHFTHSAKERAMAAHRRHMAMVKRLDTMRERYGSASVHIGIRMFVSEWFVCAADGLPTRIIRQVER